MINKNNQFKLSSTYQWKCWQMRWENCGFDILSYQTQNVQLSVLLLVWFYFGEKTAVYGWSAEISHLQFALDFGDFQQQSPSAFVHLVCSLSVLPYFYFSGVFTILLLSHVHCVPSLTVVFSQCVTNRTYSLFFQGAWAALCSCCSNSIFFFCIFNLSLTQAGQSSRQIHVKWIRTLRTKWDRRFKTVTGVPESPLFEIWYLF